MKKTIREIYPDHIPEPPPSPKKEMTRKDILKHLKKNHPYPKDVFIEPTKEQWDKFHRLLSSKEMPSGAFIGTACRIGYNACLHQLENI